MTACQMSCKRWRWSSCSCVMTSAGRLLLAGAQTLREAAQRGANASSGERRPADTLGATGQEILDAFEVRLAVLCCAMTRDA